MTRPLASVHRWAATLGAAVALGGTGAWAADAPEPSDPGEPFSLDDAFRTALQHSPQLRLAEEEVVVARAGRMKSFSLLHPQVSIAGSYTLNDEAAGMDLGQLYGAAGATYGLYSGLISSGFMTDEQCAEAAPLLLGDDGQGVTTCADLQAGIADLSGDFDTSGTSTTAWIVPKHQLQFGFSVNLPLTARAPSLIGAATQQVSVAQAQARRARQELLFGVYQAYLGVVKTQQLVAIQAQAEAASQAHYDTTKVRFDLGQIPETLLLRAEVELLQARRDRHSAERGAREVRRGLALAMGVESFDGAATPPPPLEVPGGDDETLVAAALQERPDLAAARAGEAAARTLKSDALAQFAPSFNLALQYGRSWAWAKEDGEWVDAAGGLTGKSDQWSFAVQAQLPLWDGGTRIAQVQEATSRLRQAALQREQLRQLARKEITDSLETISTSETNLTAARRQVDLAEQGLRLTEARYRLGQDGQLSVLDAKLALEQARLGLLAEELDRDLARATLLRAVGRFGTAVVR